MRKPISEYRERSKFGKMVKNIIEVLIHASEKAANIARVCRQNEHLVSLLVEQKSTEEANPRFVRDFKTLADVLIQETIRYDVGAQVSESCLHANPCEFD